MPSVSVNETRQERTFGTDSYKQITGQEKTNPARGNTTGSRFKLCLLTSRSYSPIVLVAAGLSNHVSSGASFPGPHPLRPALHQNIQAADSWVWKSQSVG
jgi:hypothetical protein